MSDYQIKNPVTFDIECYQNYYLLMCVDIYTKEILYEYCIHNDQVITDEGHFDHQNITYVSFNGLKYDNLILSAQWANATNRQMKDLSDRIIKDRMMPWAFEREYGVNLPTFDHVDIIEVSPQSGSLKAYGARMGSRLLQELPIAHDDWIMPCHLDTLREYCYNDNLVTIDLFEEISDGKGSPLSQRIRMSNEYGEDLRSKSDAQIPEALMRTAFQHQYNFKLKRPDSVPKSMVYTPPDFITFQTPEFQEILDRVVDSEYTISAKQQLVIPKALLEKFQIGEKVYKMGVGGLHTQNDQGSWHSKDGKLVKMPDVSGMYPNIIKAGGFHPTHIPKAFWDSQYNTHVDRRQMLKDEYFTCKDEDRKAELVGEMATGKIINNGTYGKLGSKWSPLYSPITLLHTTLTGQLILFMLIEQLHINGIPIISANTDSVTVHIEEDDVSFLDEILRWWEVQTGLKMDCDDFDSIHYRDVNNYVAVKPGGKTYKGKGVYTLPSLTKNPSEPIVYRAVAEYLRANVPIRQTIWTCADIQQFVTVRKVNGGAVKDGENLGGMIRWYHSTDTDTPIRYKTSGNKVPMSDNSKPIMNFDEDRSVPSDLDYEYYIGRAKSALAELM